MTSFAQQVIAVTLAQAAVDRNQAKIGNIQRKINSRFIKLATPFEMIKMYTLLRKDAVLLSFVERELYDMKRNLND